MESGAGARQRAVRRDWDRQLIKPMPDSIPSNFGFLQVHDAQLVRFGISERMAFLLDKPRAFHER